MRKDGYVKEGPYRRGELENTQIHFKYPLSYLFPLLPDIILTLNIPILTPLHLQLHM